MRTDRLRIALLADVHGNHAGLAAVLQRLHGQVDRYLFLGDFCGYHPYVRECLAQWPESEIVGVRGNHDQVLLNLADGVPVPREYPQAILSSLQRALTRLSPQHLTRLRALPERQLLTVENVTLAMYHGAPWDSLNARVYPDFQQWDRFDSIAAEIVLLGHTHYAMVKRVHGKMIINPGSVGQPRDGTGACYAVLHLPSREVVLERVVEPGEEQP